MSRARWVAAGQGTGGRCAAGFAGATDAVGRCMRMCVCEPKLDWTGGGGLRAHDGCVKQQQSMASWDRVENVESDSSLE